MRDLTAELTGLGPTVAYVSIVYQSRLASVFRACSSNRVMTIRVMLPALLGQRDLMVNSDTTFAPGRGALMRRCNDFGCGPFIEPPASCITRSYQQAMLSTGPPMDAAYQVLGCAGRWLALDVVWPGGPAGCDAPCHPHMVVTRWFFRAGPHGWVTITTALTAGCAQVHKAEPRFPARLCAGLPAPGVRTPAPTTDPGWATARPRPRWLAPPAGPTRTRPGPQARSGRLPAAWSRLVAVLVGFRRE